MCQTSGIYRGSCAADLTGSLQCVFGLSQDWRFGRFSELLKLFSPGFRGSPNHRLKDDPGRPQPRPLSSERRRSQGKTRKLPAAPNGRNLLCWRSVLTSASGFTSRGNVLLHFSQTRLQHAFTRNTPLMFLRKAGSCRSQQPRREARCEAIFIESFELCCVFTLCCPSEPQFTRNPLF